MGRLKFVSSAEATTLNRIAFLILQPAVLFPLVNGVDLSAFYFDAIAIYAVAQVVVFTCALLVGVFILKCAVVEAWLLAMATVFVNSLLYIWPISSLIYGDDGNLPITAVRYPRGLTNWEIVNSSLARETSELSGIHDLTPVR